MKSYWAGMIALVAAIGFVTPSLTQAVSSKEVPEWQYSSSLASQPKYENGFKQYDYVNPDAPKSGTLNQVAVGTFDTLNPFTIQGVAAAGLNEAGGLLYDGLMSDATDQASTMYPLIAEALQYPADFSWVKFRINPNAKWHDNTPISVEDVIWSFETLKEQSPLFNKYYGDVISAQKTGDLEVLFTFSEKNNRELPQIMGQLPVLPKHWWQGKDAKGNQRNIAKPTLEAPLGSGAYKIEKVVPGKSITWVLADNYWAKDIPVNRGRYNFQRMHYEYFLSEDATWEAFKKGGLYDYRLENRAQRWIEGYNFPAVERGDVIKKSFEHHSYGRMQGFFLNTRLAKFNDLNTRKALSYLYDFESANRMLFFNQYQRIKSFYVGTPLAARDLPSEAEIQILNTVKDAIPEEVFTQKFDLPVFDTPQATRENLREALRLFGLAGWRLNGKKLVNEKGEQFTIEFLGKDQTDEKIINPYLANLRRVGIDANLRIVDVTQYQARVNDFDYDVITTIIAQSWSPGNEQREMWGSKAADFKGSRNYAGIKNPAVDKLIERVIYSKDYDDLTAATHALDRVLLWNYYVIPQYYTDKINIAFWNKFGIPENQPDYSGIDVYSWWIDAQDEQVLEAKGE